MKYTQTISTEYHPCEILPVVFGAPCSVTFPLSGSPQPERAGQPAANAASHRSTSTTTNLAGTNQTAPPASPSASGEQLAKGEYLSQLRQQAEAWRAVASALDKHFPKWNGWDGRCPREYAVGVIAGYGKDIGAVRTMLENVRAQNDSLTAQLSAMEAASMAGEAALRAEVERVQSDLEETRSILEAVSCCPKCETCKGHADKYLAAKSEKGGAQ